jgi:hypothetical protein
MLVSKPQRFVDNKDHLVASTIFVEGPDGSVRDAGETCCRAVEGTNVHATTCFLNQDAICTSHRGICMQIKIAMRCGIIRVIAQGQTKDKTSFGPGLLFPINRDARIRLPFCSYKSRRAPSAVLGETPRTEDFLHIVRKELVRVRVALTLNGERAHAGAMIHVTALDHAE